MTMWRVVSQKYGTNATGLLQILDMAFSTTWNVLNKLRRTMVREEREKLGPVAEVDESFHGGLEEGNPGRGAEKKSLNVVAVELSVDDKRMSRVRMAMTPDASALRLSPSYVCQNAEPIIGARRF
jgi:hypothetical protein